MNYLRLLLFPFAVLYGVVILIRNWFYDAGWFKSTTFSIPVISVGNLAVGGAGKSPMTEYLVQLLKNENKPAILSRGYGRKTKGFVLATARSTAVEIGDEPAQFKHKFPEIAVAVCEDRVLGINRLKATHDVIILDDAFQHRAVKPGLSVLLFDYNKLDDPQLVLPAGNLREPLDGKMRADVFVVTKCPATVSENEQRHIVDFLTPYPYQKIFFTSIKYLPYETLQSVVNNVVIDAQTTVFLLTGIANSGPLIKHLKSLTPNVIHHKYADHHQFSLKNISKLADDFNAAGTPNKVIITTEKDAQRLNNSTLLPALLEFNILVLPIGVEFLSGGKQQFDKLIKDYVRTDTANNRLH